MLSYESVTTTSQNATCANISLPPQVMWGITHSEGTGGGQGDDWPKEAAADNDTQLSFPPPCGKQPRPGGNKIYIWIPRPFIQLLECAIPPLSQKIQFTSSLCISQTWSTGFLQSFRQCFWLPDFNISWNFWISWTFSDFICVGHPAWAPEEFRASRLIYLNVGVSYIYSAFYLPHSQTIRFGRNYSNLQLIFGDVA